MSKIDVNTCICCEYYSDGICNQTTLYAPTSKQVALCKDIECCFIKDFFKQIQQLKQENEELKKQLMQKDEVDTFFNTLDWNNDPCKICPQKNCLDKIEEICHRKTDGLYTRINPLNEILQKIKEVKENE